MIINSWSVISLILHPFSLPPFILTDWHHINSLTDNFSSVNVFDSAGNRFCTLVIICGSLCRRHCVCVWICNTCIYATYSIYIINLPAISNIYWISLLRTLRIYSQSCNLDYTPQPKKSIKPIVIMSLLRALYWLPFLRMKNKFINNDI